MSGLRRVANLAVKGARGWAGVNIPFKLMTSRILAVRRVEECADGCLLTAATGLSLEVDSWRTARVELAVGLFLGGVVGSFC